MLAVGVLPVAVRLFLTLIFRCDDAVVGLD
jgi:hypothetical protein